MKTHSIKKTKNNIISDKDSIINEIIDIYSATESLLDTIKKQSPLYRIQNFKIAENLLDKIDNILPKILQLYSYNLYPSNIRLHKIFTEIMLLSVFWEFKEVQYKMSLKS